MVKILMCDTLTLIDFVIYSLLGMSPSRGGVGSASLLPATQNAPRPLIPIVGSFFLSFPFPVSPRGVPALNKKQQPQQ